MIELTPDVVAPCDDDVNEVIRFFSLDEMDGMPIGTGIAEMVEELLSTETDDETDVTDGIHLLTQLE